MPTDVVLPRVDCGYHTIPCSGVNKPLAASVLLHIYIECIDGAFVKEGVTFEWGPTFCYSVFRFRQDCQRPNLLFSVPRGKNRRTGCCIRYLMRPSQMGYKGCERGASDGLS